MGEVFGGLMMLAFVSSVFIALSNPLLDIIESNIETLHRIVKRWKELEKEL